MNTNEHTPPNCLISKPMQVGERKQRLVLTCVCADVSSEQPRSGEGLSTGGTHAGERV